MDKCVTCRFNTNDYVCHPHCSGCDGKSNYERGIFKMKDYNALATIIHENAVSHGWWEKERSFAEIVALIHSELSEALEEYRSGKPFLYFVIETIQQDGKVIPEMRTDYGDGNYGDEKPEGIVVELADTVIRILDYAGKRKWDIQEATELRSGIKNKGFTLPELVAKCHYFVSEGYADEESRSVYFADCINLISSWCADNGGDLDEAIVIKHEYNKSRPYRHGGKKC